MRATAAAFQARCRVSAIIAMPPAVAATASHHQACELARSPRAIPGSSGGSPADGASMKVAKPASPHISPVWG
jgi:hypothetical protein